MHVQYAVMLLQQQCMPAHTISLTVPMITDGLCSREWRTGCTESTKSTVTMAEYSGEKHVFVCYCVWFYIDTKYISNKEKVQIHSYPQHIEL